MDKPTDNENLAISIDDLEEALTYPVDAFVSPEYAKQEGELLWARIWQMAGRLEDIPEVGDYFTYNILEESIIVVRTAADTIKAYYNVCPHRGRQLINTPDDTNTVCGRKASFVCGFHGWRYNLDGQNTYVLDPEDWKGALNAQRTCLSELKVDTWAGWVYINMDPDCEPLRDFLEPAAGILDPFELGKMRYKWRQWSVYPCNWKTAIEAFMEPYHVAGTHTQLLKYGEFYAYSKAYGIHGVSGFDERNPERKNSQSTSVTRVGKGDDPRISTYELARENFETLNYSGSTQTIVNAASRLVDELPEDTPSDKVIAHMMASAKADDAARGVIWPEISPQHMAEAGLAWSLFPNQTILQGVTFALCYRTRPYGDDPNKCIFEAYALERFPESEEPETEWVKAEPNAEEWGKVLAQDFANMEWVQKGMKSRGFRGTLPNPHQERKITNFHRVLAQYMGTASPRLLDE